MITEEECQRREAEAARRALLDAADECGAQLHADGWISRSEAKRVQDWLLDRAASVAANPVTGKHNHGAILWDDCPVCHPVTGKETEE